MNSDLGGKEGIQSNVQFVVGVENDPEAKALDHCEERRHLLHVNVIGDVSHVCGVTNDTIDPDGAISLHDDVVAGTSTSVADTDGVDAADVCSGQALDL